MSDKLITALFNHIKNLEEEIANIKHTIFKNDLKNQHVYINPVFDVNLLYNANIDESMQMILSNDTKEHIVKTEINKIKIMNDILNFTDNDPYIQEYIDIITKLNKKNITTNICSFLIKDAINIIMTGVEILYIFDKKQVHAFKHMITFEDIFTTYDKKTFFTFYKLYYQIKKNINLFLKEKNKMHLYKFIIYHKYILNLFKRFSNIKQNVIDIFSEGIIENIYIKQSSFDFDDMITTFEYEKSYTFYTQQINYVV